MWCVNLLVHQMILVACKCSPSYSYFLFVVNDTDFPLEELGLAVQLEGS